MINLCELTGLTQADLTEITSYILGIHIAGVFAGKVLFWTLMRGEKLIDFWVDRFAKHIRKIKAQGLK